MLSLLLIITSFVYRVLYLLRAWCYVSKQKRFALNCFSFHFDAREHLADRFKARITKRFDTVTKNLSNALDFNQPRSSTRHHTPDVLKTQTGKVATKTQRQGTPTQERQE